MTSFRWVNSDFAVSPQLSVEDVAAAAAAGFKTIVNNRPDGEMLGQPAGAAIEAAARAHGLVYLALPFAGQPPPNAVAATAELLGSAPAPVLAYCRSGARSISAWAMAEALAGASPPEQIIASAHNAGYDISGARAALEALAPKG